MDQLPLGFDSKFDLLVILCRENDTNHDCVCILRSDFNWEIGLDDETKRGTTLSYRGLIIRHALNWSTNWGSIKRKESIVHFCLYGQISNQKVRQQLEHFQVLFKHAQSIKVWIKEINIDILINLYSYCTLHNTSPPNETVDSWGIPFK